MSRRIRRLIILALAFWAVIAIATGVMLLRDGGYDMRPLLDRAAGLLSPKAETAAPPDMAQPKARIDVIDVGQGSSLLIRLLDESRYSILIDAGEAFAADAVLGAVEGAGLSRLDLLIITHPHTDHFGGAIELLQSLEVDEVWLPDVPEELTPTNVTFSRFIEAMEQNGCRLSLKSSAEALPLSDDASLSLLDGFVAGPDDLNDTSLCLRLQIGERSLLVTGDGETAVEEALMSSGSDIDADVFIAGHHGSNTSNGQRFLNAVTPKATVISVGRDNDYNLPSPKALERLSQFGSVFRTDINGTVTIFTDGAVFHITDGGMSETLG